MICLSNLRKQYNSRLILHIPSLKIDKGIYWLRGPNGAGKTTLLKIIAGIIPFDGEVDYMGINLRKQPLKYRQMIGWSEAEPLFPEFVTGTELIKLYTRIKQAQENLAKELVEMFDMSDYISQAIRTYSSGMQKKLGIVLALIGRPDLVILDEPLITLDQQSVNILLALMNDWEKNYGIDFLVSSHVAASPVQTASHQEILLTQYSSVYEQ